MSRALLLLACLFAGSVHAADPPDATAAGAAPPATDTAVDRRAMQAWLAGYSEALRQQRDARVAGLITEDATFTQTFVDEGIAPLLVTLTRAEYLQQLRALWRFATSTRYDISKVRGTAASDGSMNVEMQLYETWELFGRDTGLDSQVQFRLVRQDGVVRATDFRFSTNPW